MASRENQEGLYQGMVAFQSQGKNKGKIMKHTRMKLIKDLYSGLHHSLSHLGKQFLHLCPKQQQLHPGLKWKTDISSGRPYKEKLSGEISAYPGLGKGGTGRCAYVQRLSPSKLRPAERQTEECGECSETAQLSNQSKVPSRKANSSTASIALSKSLL